MAHRMLIEMNSAGIEQMLRSSEVEDALLDLGEKVMQAAGEGHEMDSWQGKDRVRVTIRTATTAAKRAEATDRTLTRAGSGSY